MSNVQLVAARYSPLRTIPEMAIYFNTIEITIQKWAERYPDFPRPVFPRPTGPNDQAHFYNTYAVWCWLYNRGWIDPATDEVWSVASFQCQNGHLKTEDNLLRDGRCRTCASINNRIQWERKKALASR